MEYSPLHSLCESITDCPHSTPEWTTSGKIVIRNQNIKGGKLELSNPSFTTTHDFERRITRAKPASGDIIITREAPMGEACLVPDGLECCLGQRMVLLKPDNKKCNNKYLLYAILSRYVQHQISWSSGTGTTVSNLRIPHLENLSIPCPDRRIQDSIAATLSCLDDKIELNNRIIVNLEAQAQAIFKNWFVDFEPFQDGEFEESDLGMIPKGWSVVPFTEKVRVLGGGTPKTDIVDNWNGDIPFFTPKDAGSTTYTLKTEKTLSQEGLDSCNSGLYPENTVFVTARGTVGKIALAGKPMAMNQSCYALVGKNEISQYFVYHLTLNTVERLKGKASGAVFDAIVTRDFESEMVVTPEDDEIAAFSILVEPLYRQMLCLEKQNIALRTTRDTLLPKLMSGHIEVPVEG